MITYTITNLMFLVNLTFHVKSCLLKQFLLQVGLLTGYSATSSEQYFS